MRHCHFCVPAGTIPTLQDLYITRLKTKIERPKKCVAKMIFPLNNFQRHFEKGPKPPRFQPAPVASGSGGVGLALLSAAALEGWCWAPWCWGIPYLNGGLIFSQSMANVPAMFAYWRVTKNNLNISVQNSWEMGTFCPHPRHPRCKMQGDHFSFDLSKSARPHPASIWVPSGKLT